MADEKAPDDYDRFSDSSFVENSQSESEMAEEEGCSEEGENAEDTSGSGKACPEDDGDGIQSAASKHAGAKAGNKKRKQSELGDTGGRKSKKARNTTYASKIECLDGAEIREFVRNPPPCCQKKCLSKLAIFADRAVKAVNDIRVARFKGARGCAIAISVIDLHPGVKNIS